MYIFFGQHEYHVDVINALVKYRNWGGISASNCADRFGRYVEMCYKRRIKPTDVAKRLAKAFTPSDWRPRIALSAQPKG
jgi:hypothetical protein